MTMTAVLRRKIVTVARRSSTLAGGGTRLARQVLVVLALVALALSAAVFTLLRQVREVSATQQASTQALSAARTAAQDILAYDYRTIDADISRAANDTTGVFRKQYEDTAVKLVKPQATAQQTIVQAAVRAASVEDASPDRVVVLMFVDQATTRASDPTPRLSQDRVRMTLVKVDGRWLVSKIDAL